MDSTTPETSAVRSTEAPALEQLDRLKDIHSKQERIAELLKSNGWDALLLQRPSNFSWLTSGGNNSRGFTEQLAALFITPDARVVVTNNCDSGQLFDEEIPQLGFGLKERAWTEPPDVLLDDLCRGRIVASDTGDCETINASAEIRNLRLRLSNLECARMRIVGRYVAHAVEATARTLEQGQTEAEIAGQMAHRLIHHQLTPVRVQVLADGRGKRHRHWNYSNDPLQKWCVLSAIGSRWGVCVAVTRTVCFGSPPDALCEPYQAAAMVEATGIYFSQPGMIVSELFGKIRRIYEKFDHDQEWRICDQGGVIGYEPCDVPISPASQLKLTTDMAVHWQPSIAGAMLGDTILIAENGYEPLGMNEGWPRMSVAVKGCSIECPDFLVREK